MITKTAILIPYFGYKPEWFDYFLLTCSKNLRFDWLFFTDCLKSRYNYSNTRFIPMTLDDFNILSSEKLGFDIRIKHPYKICELKPAYGLIFEGFLKDYEFWGYGDIDLVYGNILEILPDNWETKYDILANNINFIPGHFCILRNNKMVKTLFTQIKSYRKIFQSPYYHGFDEILHPLKVIPHSGIISCSKAIKTYYHLILSGIIRQIKKTSLKKPSFIKIRVSKNNKFSSINDFSDIVRYHVSIKNINVWYNISYSSDLMLRRKKIAAWRIEWKNGRLLNKNTNETLMYFHFFLSKTSRKFILQKFEPDITRFYLSKTGIRCEY